MQPFVYTAAPARIVFSAGSSADVAEEIRRLGLSRALVLSTPQQKGDAEALAARLGRLAAGVFSEAAMHTPVEVTKTAVEAYHAAGADCVVSLGGGSTTGLGKAIALRTDATQIVIPTTYLKLGSHTHSRPDGKWCENHHTRAGDLAGGGDLRCGTDARTAGRHQHDERAQRHGPCGGSALCAGSQPHRQHDGGGRAAGNDRSASSRAAAPQDIGARETALYGAWLCGTVLGAVGMSLHHKLCHTLGGSLDLPHAETHAVLLPHTIAYVEEAAPDLLAPLAALVGGRAGAGLFDFAARLGAPSSLAALGVGADDLDPMAELATANPYWCPRPIEKTAMRDLLQRAFEGARPA